MADITRKTSGGTVLQEYSAVYFAEAVGHLEDDQTLVIDKDAIIFTGPVVISNKRNVKITSDGYYRPMGVLYVHPNFIDYEPLMNDSFMPDEEDPVRFVGDIPYALREDLIYRFHDVLVGPNPISSRAKIILHGADTAVAFTSHQDRLSNNYNYDGTTWSYAGNVFIGYRLPLIIPLYEGEELTWDYLIKFEGCTECTIENLHFDAQQIPTSGEGTILKFYHCLEDQGSAVVCNKLVIRNLFGNSSCAISVESCDSLSATECYSKGSGRAGFHTRNTPAVYYFNCFAERFKFAGYLDNSDGTDGWCVTWEAESSTAFNQDASNIDSDTQEIEFASAVIIQNTHSVGIQEAKISRFDTEYRKIQQSPKTWDYHGSDPVSAIRLEGIDLFNISQGVVGHGGNVQGYGVYSTHSIDCPLSTFNRPVKNILITDSELYGSLSLNPLVEGLESLIITGTSFKNSGYRKHSGAIYGMAYPVLQLGDANYGVSIDMGDGFAYDDVSSSVIILGKSWEFIDSPDWQFIKGTIKSTGLAKEILLISGGHSMTTPEIGDVTLDPLMNFYPGSGPVSIDDDAFFLFSVDDPTPLYVP